MNSRIWSIGFDEAISSAAVGRIDAVEARADGRRRADAHVHLAGAGVAHHLHDLATRRAAHDGIVDDDDPLAGEHLGLRVELHLHAEVADGVARLDERAADVVVANQPHLERQARLLGEYPSAAGTPESGTGMTMSASAGCSMASWRPSCLRTS